MSNIARTEQKKCTTCGKAYSTTYTKSKNCYDCYLVFKSRAVSVLCIDCKKPYLQTNPRYIKCYPCFKAHSDNKMDFTINQFQKTLKP